MKFSRSTLLCLYFACDELERSPKLGYFGRKALSTSQKHPHLKSRLQGHYVDNDTTLGAWYDYLGSKGTTYDQ